MNNPFRDSMPMRVSRIVKRAIAEGRTDELRRRAKELQERHQKRHSEFRAVQRTMSRPLFYETVDGTGELGMATGLLGLALSGYAFLLLRPSLGSFCIQWSLLMGGCVGPYFVRKAIKEHITWPRTGYAAAAGNRDRENLWTMRIGLAVLLGTFLFLASGYVREMRHQSATGGSQIVQTAIEDIPMSHAAYIGRDVMEVAVVLLYLMASAVRFREQPWRVLVLAVLALGSLAINFNISGGFNHRMLPLMLFFGVMWLISGVASLCLYLRHNPPLLPETE